MFCPHEGCSRCFNNMVVQARPWKALESAEGLASAMRTGDIVFDTTLRPYLSRRCSHDHAMSVCHAHAMSVSQPYNVCGVQVISCMCGLSDL